MIVDGELECRHDCGARIGAGVLQVALQRADELLRVHGRLQQHIRQKRKTKTSHYQFAEALGHHVARAVVLGAAVVEQQRHDGVEVGREGGGRRVDDDFANRMQQQILAFRLLHFLQDTV